MTAQGVQVAVPPGECRVIVTTPDGKPTALARSVTVKAGESVRVFFETPAVR